MDRPRSRFNAWRIVLATLKIALPVAIIAWLLASLDERLWADLRERPKDWRLLAGAFGLLFTATSLSFCRWFLLVRALGLPFRLRDAFRLGFLGFLFNFVSAGSLGGDLFKAFFIAREQTRRWPEAVASVVVDRLFGIYGLMLVTTTAMLLLGVPDSTLEVRAICRTTLAATGLGTIGLTLLLIPRFTRGRLAEFLGQLPKIGPIIARLISAVRRYQTHWRILPVALAISLIIHSLIAVAVFFAARGLFPTSPTLGEHFTIVPLSAVAGALPFTPAGLGAFEFAMDELYRVIPASGSEASGVLVALVYRVLTIGIAMVGVVFYWTCRRELRQLIEEAESLSRS